MSEPGKMTPEEWLCSVIDVATRAASRPEGPRFRVVKVDTSAESRHVTVVTVLDRDTGAAWDFACSVRRQPVEGAP